MKKNKIFATGICAIIVILAVSIVGLIVVQNIKNKKQVISNENTPLVLSTQALDGVFNPFFATSGYDTEIVGMTQIGMLGTDDNAKVKVGENEATVALDYNVVQTDTRENKDDKEDYENYFTTYQFLIKNDILFSDGTPLTIRDVLFNLYVYLDPVYSGSSTMYSVNIQGLKAYQSQSNDKNIQDQFDLKFEIEAEERIQNIVYWADDSLADDPEVLAQVQEDIETVKELFMEELRTDWNSAESSISSYEDTYKFTEAWQVFLYMYGLITIKADVENTEVPEALDWNGWDTRGKNMTKEEIIEAVFKNYTDDLVPETYKTNLKNIVRYYNTAITAKAKFATEAKEAYLEEIKNSETGLAIKNISGITHFTTSSFNGINYDESMEVLQIVINGVDPKAIWNFGFAVAPMHYYSTPEEVAKWDGEEHFGVDYSNTKFMSQIQSNVVPVGAGPYRASSRNESASPTIPEFFENNSIVYFLRNDNFLLGKPLIRKLRYKVISSNRLFDAVVSGEVHYADPTAKWEYTEEVKSKDNLKHVLVENLGYGYIGINSKYITSLSVRRAIMYAMDTSLVLDFYTNEMASLIYRPMSSISWAYPDGCNEFYPFIGRTYASEEEQIAFITSLIESDGFKKNTKGIYQRTNAYTRKTETLTYTFTLAGESTDHPAWNTFKAAETLLEKCGFKIQVTNDADALSKLAEGSLEVWAAAWSSTVDPDLYQVYHKDSKATSVNNWGYPWLKENGSREEKETLETLAELIEAGRTTTVQSERETIYSQALDLIMSLAFELPTYQRKNLFVYNCDIIDETTINQKPSSFNGPLSRIWEVSLKETK